MARSLQTRAGSDDAARRLSALLARLLHQPVEPADLTSNPVAVEMAQVGEEARAIRQTASSDEEALDNLLAWSETRPLPVLDAHKRQAGLEVGSPSTVATVLARAGVQ